MNLFLNYYSLLVTESGQATNEEVEQIILARLGSHMV